MTSVQEPRLIEDRAGGEFTVYTPNGHIWCLWFQQHRGWRVQGTVYLLHVLQFHYPVSGLLFSVKFPINARRILHCWGWSLPNLQFQFNCTKEISTSALKLHEWHADIAVLSSFVSSVLNTYWSPELLPFSPNHSWRWAVHSSVQHSPLLLWHHWD